METGLIMRIDSDNFHPLLFVNVSTNIVNNSLVEVNYDFVCDCPLKEIMPPVAGFPPQTETAALQMNPESGGINEN